MTVIDYPTIRNRPGWLPCSTVLSAVLLTHFLMSVGTWMQWFVGILRNPYMRDGFVHYLLPAAPAFVLCGLSIGVFLLALRGSGIARRWLVLQIVFAIAFFATDIYFQRYQIEVGIATRDYWDNGGYKHHYFTWWWFNDRWFD